MNRRRVAKRSVTIGGHRTSYSVEAEFQAEIAALARAGGCSLSSLVAAIDAARGDGENLSSAIRLHVLRSLKAAAGR
jgi:predicted DNA-binding ribbon-helix-helix protein